MFLSRALIATRANTQRRMLLNSTLCGSRGIFFHFRKEEQNLYAILSVKTNSSQKDVKLAYYKMAKKYHPDFLASDEFSDAERKEALEMFKKIQKAYETLGSPIARQAYDIEENINEDLGGAGDGSRDIYED